MNNPWTWTDNGAGVDCGSGGWAGRRAKGKIRDNYNRIIKNKKFLFKKRAMIFSVHTHIYTHT